MFNACHFHYFENGYLRTKPYNPILGEQFISSWKHATTTATSSGSTTSFVSEQVSHHPPCSAIHMENKSANFVLEATMGVSVSLGFNKATSNIFGPFSIKLLNVQGML